MSTNDRDGSLKAELRKDIGHFIFKDPELFLSRGIEGDRLAHALPPRLASSSSQTLSKLLPCDSPLSARFARASSSAAHSSST